MSDINIHPDRLSEQYNFDSTNQKHILHNDIKIILNDKGKPTGFIDHKGKLINFVFTNEKESISIKEAKSLVDEHLSSSSIREQLDELHNGNHEIHRMIWKIKQSEESGIDTPISPTKESEHNIITKITENLAIKESHLNPIGPIRYKGNTSAPKILSENKPVFSETKSAEKSLPDFSNEKYKEEYNEVEIDDEPELPNENRPVFSETKLSEESIITPPNEEYREVEDNAVITSENNPVFSETKLSEESIINPPNEEYREIENNTAIHSESRQTFSDKPRPKKESDLSIPKGYMDRKPIPAIPQQGRQIFSDKPRPKKESGLSMPKGYMDRKPIPAIHSESRQIFSDTPRPKKESSIYAPIRPPKRYMDRKPIPAIHSESKQIFSENNEIEDDPMATNKSYR